MKMENDNILQGLNIEVHAHNHHYDPKTKNLAAMLKRHGGLEQRSEGT